LSFEGLLIGCYKVAAEASMTIIRLFIFSYIFWITQVIKHFKLPVDQIPELSFRASINETADKASTSILRTIEKSVDPHSDVLKQLFQAISDDAFKVFQTSELVIAYDEYAILE